MRFGARGKFLRVEALAVVLHHQPEIAAVAERHRHVCRHGVLAHIGERLLQDEQHLQLLLRRQWPGAAALVDGERCFGAALPTKAAHGLFHCRAQLAGAEPRAEVVQQLAHVLVAFFHAVAQHRHDLAGLGKVIALDRGVQQLHLQVQVVQALGNAVVQALRYQVALFHHR